MFDLNSEQRYHLLSTTCLMDVKQVKNAPYAPTAVKTCGYIAE